MKLVKLFDAQRKLDEHITRKKGLEGQDLFAKKILALLVELGELANEWRGFKFWSNNQEPRTRHVEPDIEHFDKTREARWKESNPLLEEYVDCLHFILSIGLELGIDEVADELEFKKHYFLSSNTTLSCFIGLNYDIANLYYQRDDEDNVYLYESIFSEVISLGEMLGFTWEQVEEAYFQKNAINHERQENGY